MGPKDLLSEFEFRESKFPGPIPKSIQIGPNTNKKVGFLSCVHGNEVGSLPGVFEIIDEWESKKINLEVEVFFVLGNPTALLESKRFIEKDMNRIFGLNDDSLEGKRAVEIEPLIKELDFLLDFHQTISSTPSSFFIYEKFKNLDEIAFAINKSIKYAVRLDPQIEKENGYMTSMSYGVSQGVPALSVELSALGINAEAHRLTKELIFSSVDYVFNEKIYSNENKKQELKLLKVSHHEKFTHPKDKIIENLNNMKSVKKGDLLGEKFNGDSILSPLNGHLLFPKYPNRNSNGEAEFPLPEDLFLISIDDNMAH